MEWNVGRKIGAGYILALLIFAVVGVITYQNTTQLIEDSAWVEHTHQVLEGLESVISDLKDAETGQRGYIITGEDRYLEPFLTGVEQAGKDIKVVRELTTDNPNQQLRLSAIEPLIKEKFSELQETVELRKKEGFDSARAAVLTNRGKKIMDNLRKAIEEMDKEERELLNQRAVASKRSSKSTKLIIVVAVIVSVVILTLVGFLTTRNLSKPLGEISKIAGQIATGVLNLNITTDNRRDEIGTLAQAFIKMTRSLREMAGVAEKIAKGDLSVEVKLQSEHDVMGTALAAMVNNFRKQTQEIMEGTNILTSSVTEIGASTAQVVSSMTEMATAVEETTTTVEEVKQTAKVSIQKADNVVSTAGKAEQVSQEGRKATEDTIEEMRRIKSQMDSIAESIVRLSEQSQAVGEIIATVDDIADQSNLLAVNASIEAAKAGEHGRGFGVVAQEIRGLAEQSKQSTTAVRKILNDIQKAVSQAVMVTEQGSKAVESGMKQSTRTGEAIAALASSIVEAADAATQIAVSSKEQLIGMDQVALAMENIRQASSQNAVGSKQTETAMRDLQKLGENLKRLIEHH